MTPSSPISIVGDIHGQLTTAVALLQRSELIDTAQRWRGGSATVWFLGDFVDRGPSGLAAIELVMRLQQEAQQAGGNVQALLGNHDVLLLAAARFGELRTFKADWLRNGGCTDDLDNLKEQHIAWLSQLPAMARIDDHLLVHADAALYLDYGHSIETVNQAFRSLLQHDSPDDWDALLDAFSRRFEFDQNHSPQAEIALKQMFDTYGGTQLIHGHTPINYMTEQDPATVKTPFFYAQNQCVNVDGGMYVGGSGVIYTLHGSGKGDW